MKIGFVCIDRHEEGLGGGITSYLRAIIPELYRCGHEIHWIGPGEGRSADIINCGDHFFHPVILSSLHWYIHRLGSVFRWIVLPTRELEWSWALWKVVKRVQNQFDLDVLESSEIGNFFISRFARIPLVIRSHGAPLLIQRFSNQPIHFGHRLDQKLQCSAMKRARIVTTPSQFQSKQLQHYLDSSVLLKGIPNPISQYIVDAASKTSDFEKDVPPMVLYTGRIEYGKGIFTLLGAIAQLKTEHPETRCVLAGAHHSSISKVELREKIDQFGVGNNVEFPGHIPWEELVILYRRASVFVMPSYYETFGISVIEAMAFGLPVVSTTAGGLPEVVEDGITAISVSPGDCTALAEGIVKLLGNAHLRRRMGNAGREKVLREFSADRVVGQMLEVYEEVLNCNHAYTHRARGA